MILKRFFLLIAICFLKLNPILASLENTSSKEESKSDSIEISLLTCAPGDEVYSLYGHTAIRYKNFTKGIDEVINYGMFSFHKPFFILRFIFGLTDYEMGITPLEYFCQEYYYNDRDVFEQVLDLTEDEKLKLLDALNENYLPQNRVYRYNYFFDNCTTRARDIIADNIDGKIEYPPISGKSLTFRQWVHSYNQDYPWARFGNDMLLGVRADMRTTKTQSQFLPYNLMDDFSKATVKDSSGKERALVKAQGILVRTPEKAIEKEFPLSPRECALVFLALTVLITLLEIVLKKDFWAFDIILMVIDGLVGIIIFLMFFSEHPTTSTNLQIFLFNPLPLIFAYSVAKKCFTQRKTLFWRYAILSLVLFFIGGIFQDYAEGMYFLALSLLLRLACREYRQKKLNVKALKKDFK